MNLLSKYRFLKMVRQKVKKRKMRVPENREEQTRSVQKELWLQGALTCSQERRGGLQEGEAELGQAQLLQLQLQCVLGQLRQVHGRGGRDPRADVRMAAASTVK